MFNKMSFYGGKPIIQNPDILLVSFPRRTPHIYYATQPPEALARLKACTEAAGYSAQCIDYHNVYFHNGLRAPAIMEKMDEYFREVIPREYQGMREKLLDQETLNWYNNYLNAAVENVIKINPTWLGVSMFSEQSIRASVDFLELLREQAPNIKVVIGGYCIQTWAFHTREGGERKRIGDWILSQGLTDYFVTGEGELALVELMKGNSKYSGINNYEPKQIDNLNSLPIPDYTDFDFRKYVFPNPRDLTKFFMPMIGVTGSRGCVRNCVFCDINTKWPKYRFLDPVKLAKEVQFYMERFNVNVFNFTDSLINASPPMLRKYCEEMVEFKNKTGRVAEQLSQFIVRDEKQMPEDLWSLISKSGFHRAIFGVESGSEKVRWDMDKKFKNDALYYSIDQARKNNMSVEVLIIVGYPTETHEDFVETLKVAKHYAPNITGDKEVMVSLSSFGMEYDWDETKLNRQPEIHDITFDPVIGWISPITNNYESLLRERAMYDLLEELGYDNYYEWVRENIEGIADVEERLRDAGREDEIMVLPPIELEN